MENVEAKPNAKKQTEIALHEKNKLKILLLQDQICMYKSCLIA